MLAANDNGPLAPRLLSRTEAAGYCGFKSTAFSEHVRSGRLPPAIPGLKKWDRKALDSYLDKVSGLANDNDTEETDPWAEYDRKKNAGKP